MPTPVTTQQRAIIRPTFAKAFLKIISFGRLVRFFDFFIFVGIKLVFIVSRKMLKSNWGLVLLPLGD